jgi:glutathione S-transferase
MLKLLGRANSINVQKAHWAIEEIGLPYERVDIGGAFGGNDKAEYLAKNPNGRVPTLEDDGFVLWESNVIVRYIASKYSPGNLWPSDLRQRADADRWMDWQQTVLAPAMFASFWGLIRTAPEKRDATAIAKSADDTAKAMTILDRALAGRAYVAGDAFTMGDIPVGCAVHRWLNLPLERPQLANLGRWYASIAARPAAKKLLVSPIS